MELYIEIGKDTYSSREISLSYENDKIVVTGSDNISMFDGRRYKYEHTLDELNNAKFYINE